MNILYVSRAGLPVSAPGIRMAALGTVMKKIGYEVHYLCNRRITNADLMADCTEIEPQQFSLYPQYCLNQDEKHYLCSGHVYSYLPLIHTKAAVIGDCIDFFLASRIIKRIKAISLKEKTDVIILYDDDSFITKRICRYCKSKHIKLLADVTEWYEKRPNGTLIEKSIPRNVDKRIRKYDKNLCGAFVISPFMHEYYNGIGVKNLLIPPLMSIDTNLIPMSKSYDDGIVRFVYAGSPGTKDIIYPFVNAVIDANMASLKFRIDLIGITILDVRSHGCPNASEELGVYAHGRLSHNDTISIVKTADYGVLFRHNKRYAKAGFSTKFAECMSWGVAMICNRIGGTDAVIENNLDGIIINGTSKNDFDLLLNELSSYKPEKITTMKCAAYKKAQELFDMKKYAKQIESFLNNM